MSLKNILLFLFLLTSFSIFAQKRVTGKIIDAETNEPMISVIIKEPNSSSNGTVTNLDGFFELEITGDQIEVCWGSYFGCDLYDIDQNHLTGLVFYVPQLSVDVDPVEVVGNYTPQGNATIPAITQLSKPQLQINNEVAITPSLNLVPGILMHSGALNTNRITIRGVGNRSPFATAKIRAYLDEIPLTNGVGETTIEDLDLSFIQSVAIIKGPAASLYGAGLGGVVQLSTHQSRRRIKNQLTLGSTFGSYGLNRQTAQLDFGESQKYNMHFNFNRTHSDGYRDNNQYDRNSFSAFAKFYLDDKNEFSFFANYTSLKAFIPSSLNLDDFTNEPEKAAFTWGRVKGFEDYEKTLLGISHKTKFNNQWQWSNSLFTNFRGSYESRPFNILREQNFALGGRSSLSYLGIEAGGLTAVLKLGIEYFNESYNWQTSVTNDGVIGALLSDNEERRTYSNLFFQSEWEIQNNTQITAGLNMNSTQYDYADLFLEDGNDLSGEYEFESILSPYISIQHQIREHAIWINNINLFGIVSHGFAPPTLEETLTPDGSKNPNIQPERGWNFEIGTDGKLFQKLGYKLSFYNMYIRDLLVARRTGLDQFDGVNAGKTKHQGLELSLKYDVIYNNNFTFDLFSNYHFANYSFTEFIDDEEDFSGNELTGTAPHTFNVGANARWLATGLYGYLDFRYVDAMPMRDDNSIYSEAYQVANFKLGWQKTFDKHWGLDVYTGINNLLDAKYASMILINAGSFGGNAPRYYYPGLPRNFYGGAKLKYIF